MKNDLLINYPFIVAMSFKDKTGCKESYWTKAGS